MANDQQKHSILAEDDLPVGQVETPEWKNNPITYIRSLPELEFQTVAELDDKDNPHSRFAAMVICDEDGNRLFTDDDAEALGGKSPVVLRRITSEAMKHNGLTEDEQEKTAKNYEKTTGSGLRSSLRWH